MRADARRNRDRIVQTALDLLAERGPGVSMEEIARAAGLGVGTLYRHFPDRRGLLEEIGMDVLHRLRAEVRSLVGRELPGWEVLNLLVGYCTGQPLALLKSLAEDTAEDGAGTCTVGARERIELQREVTGLLEEIAGRAQREGAVRGDITPGEVIELFSATVCRPGARPGDAMTRVMLDGLRA
ncbi:TetR/AcrR family transcriptional regulator [Actinomadura xylanilytica]|uniref:TetR/AcrR family transcriptional regulator n=1 Tax=Actinomadura xylanilytica TaxID=887459 RepID=UPI00255AF3BD|nr:TetR/AcrR family transcriptional regulator [Actinomadura xylanilytica]MDL4771282.1 helix-turn-helix domain-containing protein [Actinomadura xylanilytica]